MTLPRTLRAIAYLEGCTLLALVCVAVPLKRLAGLPDAVAVLGPVHGMCFLLYVAAVFDTAARGPTPRAFLRQALAMSLLPGGTFWYFSRAGRVRERP